MFKVIQLMFNRVWLGTTLFIFAASAVCIRLSIWQFDRLKQRQEFNQQYIQIKAMPAIEIKKSLGVTTGIEYRAVLVSGKFDFEHEFALRNQFYENKFGYHLLTPLILEDGSAILIDRGWIPPEDNNKRVDWHKYDELGIKTISGIIRLGENPATVGIGSNSTGELSSGFINVVNLQEISRQLPYSLAEFYIQPNIDQISANPPFPFQPDIDLSEGPHRSYIIQWFSFSVIIVVGYLFYLKRQIRLEKAK